MDLQVPSEQIPLANSPWCLVQAEVSQTRDFIGFGLTGSLQVRVWKWSLVGFVLPGQQIQAGPLKPQLSFF